MVPGDGLGSPWLLYRILHNSSLGASPSFSWHQSIVQSVQARSLSSWKFSVMIAVCLLRLEFATSDPTGHTDYSILPDARMAHANQINFTLIEQTLVLIKQNPFF